MKLDEGEYLAHYGILRKSGRYPWGSGKNPLQRSITFLQVTEEMKKQGLSDPQIAKSFDDKENGFPFTTADLRALRSRAVAETTQDQIRTAQALKDKSMGFSAIGRQMGVNESTVRSLLEPGRLDKLDIHRSIADMLKRQVAEKTYVDVGANVERGLPIGDNPETKIGVSRDKFKTALSLLKEEGYSVHPVDLPQVGTGEKTKYLVLSQHPQTKEGQREVFLNRDKIRQISEKSDDGGRTFGDLGIKEPLNISSHRVSIKYKEDGGSDADGVIYVRPGVADVSLGKSRYAQVRIAVDGTHYLKGMAIYKDDLPKGVDLQFNTNKSNTGDKHDAMKPLKLDKDGNVDKGNPFGAMIKEGGQQIHNDKVTSSMNIINEEGDWNKWSRTLSTQVLSKQSPVLAESQLAWTYEKRRNEFDNIKALTNPVIRKKLIDTFAGETDSAGVHLKAANLPRQATKVILPSNHVKPTEIFAPTFRDGERVALIRFPHAGTFEIPELTVNNRSKEVQKMFGGKKDAPDAVVIHPKVAAHLSGADFDGDHVVVIPNDRGTIKSQHPLDALKGFDPQAAYKPYDGMKTIDGGIYNGKTQKVEYPKKPDGSPGSPKTSTKGHQMGNITNLIADMTLKGANSEEIARAVKHSMVVIDSEKHNLDYKASERQNGIAALKREYQGVGPTGALRGASTLITRATSEEHIAKRKARPAAEGGPIDAKTGERRFVPTGEKRKDGSTATFRIDKLANRTDATTLISDHGGTRIEHVYAEHSNKLKAMANEARLESLRTVVAPRNPSARVTYAHEVASLESKLNEALKNSPLERQAQVVANYIYAQRKRANPDMDAAEKRKIKGQALEAARLRTGAKKHRVEITDREWEAIQASAISKTTLASILKNTDVDKLRERATPRERPVMTKIMTSRAKSMLASGYSLAEVSDALGIAQSTLSSGLKEGVI